MNKKTIYYIIGGIAILGIGYYLWNKSKKSTEEKEATDETSKKEEVEPVIDKKAELSADKRKKISKAVSGTLLQAVKNMPKPATSSTPTTPVSAFEGGLDMDLNF